MSIGAGAHWGWWSIKLQAKAMHNLDNPLSGIHSDRHPPTANQWNLLTMGAGGDREQKNTLQAQTTTGNDTYVMAWPEEKIC